MLTSTVLRQRKVRERYGDARSRGDARVPDLALHLERRLLYVPRARKVDLVVRDTRGWVASSVR